MLNIAKLIRDRMIMQTKTDNIALSIAVHKARTMNFVGACNYLIGSVLAVGTKPELIQIPTLSTNEVAAFPYGDFTSGTHKAVDDDVELLKNAVEGLQKAQEFALLAHLLYQDALMIKHLTGDYKLVIYPTAVPTISNAEKYFGLKRNSKGIRYLKTINTENGYIPHIVYNPFPLKDVLDFVNSGVSALLDKVGLNPGDIIMKATGLPDSALKEQVHEEADYSWYVTDENFSDQKIQVMMVKFPKDKDSPLFAKLLGIKYPTLTTFAAAAIYNADGAMFPTEESDLIGESDMEAILIGIAGVQALIFEAQVISKDVTPYKILSIATVAYLLARLFYRGLAVKNDPKTSPINAYNAAKFGGWGAHLIPYKSRSDNKEKSYE
jgi:hypothetical protein